MPSQCADADLERKIKEKGLSAGSDLRRLFRPRWQKGQAAAFNECGAAVCGQCGGDCHEGSSQRQTHV